MNIKARISSTERKINEQKVSHILHLILSFITCGLWLFAWVIVVISSKAEISRLERVLEGLYDGES